MAEIEFFNVADFAKIVGVSKQAIYKQINNANSQLVPYLLKDGKKTIIKSSALFEIYKIKIDSQPEVERLTLDSQPEVERLTLDSQPEVERLTLDSQPEVERLTLDSQPEVERLTLDSQPEVERLTLDSQPEVERLTLDSQPEVERLTLDSQPEVERLTLDSQPEVERLTLDSQPNLNSYIDFLKAELLKERADKTEMEQRLTATILEKDDMIKHQSDQLANLAQQVAQIANNALITTSQQQYLTAAERGEIKNPNPIQQEQVPEKKKKGIFYKWFGR